MEDSLERWIEIAEENASAAKEMRYYELAFQGKKFMDTAFEALNGRKNDPNLGSCKANSQTSKRVAVPKPKVKPVSVLKPKAPNVSKASAPFGAGQLATICTKTTVNDRRSIGKSPLESLVGRGDDNLTTNSVNVSDSQDGEELEGSEVESSSSSAFESKKKKTPASKQNKPKKIKKINKGHGYTEEPKVVKKRSAKVKPDTKPKTTRYASKSLKRKALPESFSQKTTPSDKNLRKGKDPLLSSNWKKTAELVGELNEVSHAAPSHRTPAVLESKHEISAHITKKTADLADAHSWKNKHKENASKDVSRCFGFE